MTVGINVDSISGRLFAESRHGHDCAGEGNDKSCACGKFHIADIDFKSGRTTQFGSIVGQRILCFCHTNWQFVFAELFNLRNRFVCFGRVGYAVCAVNYFGDGFNLFFNRQIDVVNRSKICRFFTGFYNLLRKFDAAFAALCKNIGEGKFYIVFPTIIFQNLNLFVGIGEEVVDGDNNRNTKFLHVFHMSGKVAKTCFYRFYIWFCSICLWYTAVIFQRAQGSDNNDGGRSKTGIAAFDIKEFFGAQVGTESGFGDGVIRQF